VFIGGGGWLDKLARPGSTTGGIGSVRWNAEVEFMVRGERILSEDDS
jgi:hypothetical protein